MVPSSATVKRENANEGPSHRSSSISSSTSNGTIPKPLRHINPNEFNNNTNTSDTMNIIKKSAKRESKIPKNELANLGLNIVGTGLNQKSNPIEVKDEDDDYDDQENNRIPRVSADIEYNFLNFDQNQPPSTEIINSIFNEFLLRRAFTKEAKANLQNISISRKWLLICQERSLVGRNNASLKPSKLPAIWFVSNMKNLSSKDLHKLEKLLRSKDFIEEFLQVEGASSLLQAATPKMDDEKRFLVISCYKNIVNDKIGTDIIIQNPQILEFLIISIFTRGRILNKKISTEILLLLSFWSPPLGRNNLLKSFHKISNFNLFATWIDALLKNCEEDTDDYSLTNNTLHDFFLSSMFLIISITEGAESINDKKIIHAKFKEAGIYTLFHKFKELGNEALDEQIKRYKFIEKNVCSNDIMKELNLTDTKADILLKSIINKAGINSDLQELNNEFLDLVISIYESNSTAEASRILKLINQIIRNILSAGKSINNDSSESILNMAIQKLMDQLTNDDITRRAMSEVQQYELKTSTLQDEIKLLKESLNLSSGDILKQNNDLQLKLENKDKQLQNLNQRIKDLELVRKNEKQKWETQNAVISFNNVPISKSSHSSNNYNLASGSLLKTLSKRNAAAAAAAVPNNSSKSLGSPPLSRTSSLSKSKSSISLLALRNGGMDGSFDPIGENNSSSNVGDLSSGDESTTLSVSGSGSYRPANGLPNDGFDAQVNRSKVYTQIIPSSSLSSSSGGQDSINSSSEQVGTSIRGNPVVMGNTVSIATSSQTGILNNAPVGMPPAPAMPPTPVMPPAIATGLPPPPPLPDMLKNITPKSAPPSLENSATKPNLSSNAPYSPPPPPPPPPVLPEFLAKDRSQSAPTPIAAPPGPGAPPPPPPPLPTDLLKKAGKKDADSDSPSGPPPPPPLPKLLIKAAENSDEKKDSKFKALDTILTQNKINEISKSLHKPTKKLKQLHWDKVEEINDTMWSELSQSRTNELLELGIFQEVESLFTMRETKKVSPSSAVSKKEKTTFLARDLSQQFGINLHMFSSIPEEKLIIKILKCDSDVLNNLSVLEFFNKNELAEFSNTLIRELTPYSKDILKGIEPKLDPTNLERADRIFLELCFNLRHYWRSRSRALLMIKTYEKDYYDLSKKIQILDDSVKSIKNSKNLKSLFVLIKEIGNFMNKKQVEGFKLTSLQKLNFIKDQNQNTFMQYLEKVIRRAYPEYLGFIDELSILQNSAKMSVEQLSTDIETYIKTIKNVEASLESGNMSDPKKLHPADRVMSKVLPRLPEAKRKYQLLEDQHKFVMSDFDKLMKYFGENPSDSISKATFFPKFQEFVEDFKRVQEQNRADEEKVRIYEKRKEMMMKNKKAKAQSRASTAIDGESTPDEEDDVVDSLLKKLKGVSTERRSSTATSSRSMDHDDKKLLTRAQTLLEGTKKLA